MHTGQHRGSLRTPSLTRWAARCVAPVLALARLGAARMLATRRDILRSLDEAERPEFKIHIEFTSDGRDTGHMTVTWTLKPVTP